MSQSTELRRRVGVADATFIILGNIIGIGIFLTPAEVARTTQEPWIFLGMWLIGAIVAMAGAMSSAELGIMMPHAGGDYVFLRKTYGLPWGFLYGYLSLIFTYTGSIAVMAVGIVHYQGPTIFGGLKDVLAASVLAFDVGPFSILGLYDFQLHHYQLNVEHLVACVIILLLTGLNVRGLSSSLILQKIVTLAPVVLLVVAGGWILVMGILFDGAAWDTLSKNLSFHGSSGMPGPGVFAAAMIPVFFTYTGWNVTLYLAEDIKEPHRVIPLSMIFGLGAVALVYFLFCMVILATIPFQDLLGPNPGDISARAMGAIFGQDAQFFVSCLIALLILGTLNTTILAGSRVYLAMARDGIFFSHAKNLHPVYGTPAWSLSVQGLWACGLVIIFRDFDTILNLTTLIMVFLSMMTISSVFVLRLRHGRDHEVARMDKTPLVRALGYPYFPAFYILATALILIGTVIYREDGRDQALLGIVVSLLGFVVYAIWQRTRRKASDAGNSEKPDS